MARTNQEAVTAFGEVLRSANVPGSYNSQNNRMAANDNRLMIYFQGMKVYIPDTSIGGFGGSGAGRKDSYAISPDRLPTSVPARFVIIVSFPPKNGN